MSSSVHQEYETQHPALKAGRLAYHREFKFYKCLHCNATVPSDMLSSHLKGKGHGLAEHSEVAERIQSAYPVHSNQYPDVRGQEPIRAIEGLDVQHNGWQCILCDKVHRAISSGETHISKEHQETSTTMKVARRALLRKVPHYQELYSTYNSHFICFCVKTTARPTEKDMYSRLVEHVKMTAPHVDRTMGTLSGEDVTPLLRRTGWHELVQGLDMKRLRSLVARPRPEQETHLVRIKTVIDTYFNRIRDAVREVSVTVRMYVNSEKPDDVNATPWEFHQRGASTDRYIQHCSRLVNMAVRAYLKEYQEEFPIFLTANQVDSIRVLLEYVDREEGGDEEEALDALHRLLRGFLLQDIGSVTVREDKFALVRFMCLFHLKDQGAWSKPSETTQSLSMLAWCFRGVTLWQVRCVEKELARDGAGITRAHILAECSRLHQGLFQPFSVLLSMRGWINQLAYTESRLPQVIWLDGGGERMMVDGKVFDIPVFLRAIRAIGASITRTLRHELHCDYENDFSIPQKLVDKMQNTVPHYSYLAENKMEEHGLCIAGKILREETLRSRYCHSYTAPGGLPEWRMAEVDKWMRSAQKCLHELLVLIHLTGGAPARGTELVETKVVNGQSRARNIFWNGNHITIVLAYSKTSHTTGMDKLIPRTLPTYVSNLLHVYLQQIRPLVAWFHQHRQHRYDKPPAEKVGERPWEITLTHLAVSDGKRMDGATFSNLLGATLDVYGVGIFTVKPFRQVWQAMVNRYIKPSMTGQSGTDQVIDLQAGHTTTTADQHYGIDHESLAEVATSRYLEFQQVSALVHTFLGCDEMLASEAAVVKDGPLKIGNLRPLSGGSLTEQLEALGDKIQSLESKLASKEGTSDQLKDDILSSVKDAIFSSVRELGGPSDTAGWLRNHRQGDLETPPATQQLIGRAQVIRPVDPTPRLSGLQSQMREALAEEDWRRGSSEMGIPGMSGNENGEHSLGSDLGDGMDEDDHDHQLGRGFTAPSDLSPTDLDQSEEVVVSHSESSTVSDQEMLKAIAEIHRRDTATWKSPAQQKAADWLLHRPDEDTLLILPTAAGKTTIYQLLHRFRSRNQVTILIVPLAALMHSVIDRLRSAGEQVTGYGPGASFPHSGWMVVGAETTCDANFFRDCKQAQAEKRIARLIYDEAHIPWDTAMTYRTALQGIHRLRVLGLPTCLVTATCPSGFEDDLANGYGISSVSTFRTSSARPSLRYEVHELSNEAWGDSRLVEATCRIYEQVLKRFPTIRQTLFYCCTKAICQSLAEALGQPDQYYWREQDERMQACLAQFQSGQIKFLVCTTALGAGIDVANVDAVMVVDYPDTMLDLVQYFGRASRHGQSGYCHLMAPPISAPRMEKRRETHRVKMGSLVLIEWATGKGCRRLGLDTWMDGSSLAADCEGQGSGTVLCDVCESRGVTREDGRGHKRDSTEALLESDSARKQARHHSPPPLLPSSLGTLSTNGSTPSRQGENQPREVASQTHPYLPPLPPPLSSVPAARPRPSSTASRQADAQWLSKKESERELLTSRLIAAFEACKHLCPLCVGAGGDDPRHSDNARCPSIYRTKKGRELVGRWKRKLPQGMVICFHCFFPCKLIFHDERLKTGKNKLGCLYKDWAAEAIHAAWDSPRWESMCEDVGCPVGARLQEGWPEWAVRVRADSGMVNVHHCLVWLLENRTS